MSAPEKDDRVGLIALDEQVRDLPQSPQYPLNLPSISPISPQSPSLTPFSHLPPPLSSSLPAPDEQLVHVNASIAQLRSTLGRDVLIFAASDTNVGLERVSTILGEERVLSVRGRAVHSTRTSTPTSPEAVKVAADFLALAMSDVLFAIGGSSFSGNAAVLQAGVSRVPYGGGGEALRNDEIEVLRASLQQDAR